MFKKLKDKIKNWTKKVSEESKELEETKEEKSKEKEKKKKQEKKSKEKSSKSKKSKSDKKAEREKKREDKKKKKQKKESEKFKEKSPVPELEKKESIQEVVEEIIEEPKEKESEKKGFFKKITSKRKISESDFESYSEDLEMILLENNVALEVTEKIIENLKEKIIGKEISKKELENEIYNTLKKTIKEILIEPFDVVEKIKNRENKSKPYVILFCGVNGTGKTTSIAKFSKLLEKNNLSSVLAAGDTFRAASIEQLEKHGDALRKKVISGSYGSDPASVGFDAIKYAEKNKIDCVLIDTAGRMHTAKNLMQEIGKVSRVCNPNLKLFVGESTTGNDVLEQVKAFNEAVKIDGIILSKADIDEKGGTALSVGYVTGKPILYLGIGQNYEDLESFDKEKFIEKLGLNEE